MNFSTHTLGLAQPGARFPATPAWPIPPAILSGLAEGPDEEGTDALTLVIISSELEKRAVGPRLPGRTIAAWLPPDRDGRVGETQIRLANELGCAAIFACDTALASTEGVPVYRVANYPATLQSLPVVSEKLFPLGLVGPGFHLGTEPHPFYPWRGGVAEPLLKTFPCLSFLPETGETAREYRAQCDLAVLCGGVGGRLLPEFLEILLDGSCLVTERSVTLEALGFVDGVNCLFINPENAVAKCAGVLGDPVRLQRTREAGQKLAKKIVSTSGGEIIRSWWTAYRARHDFISHPGENHCPRRPWKSLLGRG